MRSLICAGIVAAIFVCPLVGCDSGDIAEGIPKDAVGKIPPPAPGMDDMKAKMDAKKKHR